MRNVIASRPVPLRRGSRRLRPHSPRRETRRSDPPPRRDRARTFAQSGRTSVANASSRMRLAASTSPASCACSSAARSTSERLRVGLLEVDHALDHRLDLRLDVVRLVDRQAHSALEGAVRDELVEDPEELERIDRADDQVVVAVLAIVEVEPAEPIQPLEQRDDLLDVDAVGVVAEVDEHACAAARAPGRACSAEPQSARSVA